MHKKVKLILILIVTCSCLSHFGQSDSVKIKTQRPIRKAKLMFAFDARRSFVLDNKVKFNGFKIGVEILEKHRVGLGMYFLSEPVRYVGKVDKIKYPMATDTVLFNFNYTSTYYEYVWLRSKRWELTTPVHLGLGGIQLTYIDTARNRSLPFVQQGSLLVGFGGSAQFKVFRWFAIGTGAGYRKMVTRNENIGIPLNAPFYQFQIKILFGELYRMTFKRKNLEEW